MGSGGLSREAGSRGVGYIGFPGRDFSWDSSSDFLSLGFQTFGFPLVWWLNF